MTGINSLLFSKKVITMECTSMDTAIISINIYRLKICILLLSLALINFAS